MSSKSLISIKYLVIFSKFVLIFPQAPRPFDLKFKRPASVARKIEELDATNKSNGVAGKANKAPGGLFGMCSCCNNEGAANEVTVNRRK